MLTRAVKFEVIFPSIRGGKKDDDADETESTSSTATSTATSIRRKSKRSDRFDLYQRLWGVQSDLLRAAQRLMSALWQVKIGHLPKPIGMRKDGTTSETPLQTMAYQGLSGKWQPFGHPLYTPYEGTTKKGTTKKNSRAGGGVLRATATHVYDRLQTDFKFISAGKRQMATFANMPILIDANEIVLGQDGITLTVFEGRRNNRVKIRPRKLDAGQSAILRRCGDGTLKHGSAKLWWHQREGAKGKWMFAMSWTDKDHALMTPAAESLVAGVDLGIEHAVWVAYTDQAGNSKKFNDVIEFPRHVSRAVTAVKKERRTRGKWNRKEFGLRTGHGQQRKLRAVEMLGDKIARMNDTMIRTIASATVAYAKKRGAAVIVLENHKNWSVGRLHAKADDADTKREAAQIRNSYWRWHQGAMRAAIMATAEREGMVVVEANPAWTSRTCSACGLVWKKTGMYRDEPLLVGEKDYGRIKWRRFVCSCGEDIHADRNAGINIARQGLTDLREAQEQKQAQTG